MSLFDKAAAEREDQFPEHNDQLTGHRRREARFAAAQLTYAHLLTGDALAELATTELELGKKRKFDKKYLSLLTEALATNLERYEVLLSRFEKEEWPLDRWELMHKAVCYTAIADFEHAPEDVNAGIIISEYLAIAEGFATPEQIAFLNAVLDAIGKELRPAA